MQAVILAAGEGQRLWPFTANKPKVMIRVAGKPILEYVVNALKDTGIFDIVMVVGYRKERIIDYFEDGSDFGVDITYAEQKNQLGTAHALKQAEKYVKDSFVVLPGDNIVDSRTIKYAINPTTLVYKKVKTKLSKYGSVIIDDGQVSGVVEKTEQAVTNLANIGIYCLDKSIFDHMRDEISLIPVINDMAHQTAIRGVETDGVWMDVIYPWDILKVNDMAMDFSGKTIAGKLETNVNIIGDVKIGKNTVIRGNSYIKGPAVIGEGCEIGPNTVIMPSTSIGNNVTIGASYIANSVINSNTILKAGCFVDDSVIDNGCAIEANFTTNSGLAEIKVGEELHKIEAGLFMGENCTVGPNVVTEAGTIIGNKSSISALKLLRGKVPDRSMVL